MKINLKIYNTQSHEEGKGRPKNMWKMEKKRDVRNV